MNAFPEKIRRLKFYQFLCAAIFVSAAICRPLPLLASAFDDSDEEAEFAPQEDAGEDAEEQPAPERVASSEKDSDDDEDELAAKRAKLEDEDSSEVFEDSKVSRSHRTSTILGAPRYTYERPRWAFQLGFAGRALGNIDIGQSAGGASSSNMIGLGFDYQPTSWQGAGVFGFGLTGAVYPTRTRTTNEVLKRPTDAWSAGFNLRYQARYWHEQLLVPFANYTYQRFYYDVVNGPSGFTNVYGPSFGLQVYLNRLEPSTASDGFVDTGILRTYITAEAQLLSGEDEVFSLGGTTYVLGLRLEF